MRRFFILISFFALLFNVKGQHSDSLVFEELTFDADYIGKPPLNEQLEYWDQIRQNPPSEESEYPVLIVKDFDLKDKLVWQTLYINDSSQFQFEEAVLYTGHLSIWLQSSLTLNEEGRWQCGVISGIVKNGRKEGEWVLKNSGGGEGDWVVTKRMNYKNGLLHGDFFVYTAEGDIIPYQQSSEGERAATSSFENGTGWYVDFYIFPPYQLKVRGRLVNGQKEGRWNVYDKNGDIIVSYIYQNGIIVNF